MSITQQRMAAIFNEWARLYAQNPDDFGEILDADGQSVEDYGRQCAIYFCQIAADMDSKGLLPLPLPNVCVQELEAALKKANAQAEHFEREWYLRGDELEALQAQREPLSDAQICDALGIDGSDEWTYTVARAVEAAHGITNQKCTGCAGVGLVGGLTRDGYVSDECPFCAGTGVDNSTTQEKHQ